jgi:endonuclease-3
MNKILSNEIIEQLRILIPDPKCELDFTNNFELICAVMLSAQTTDKRVNMITPALFAKYPNSKELMNADYDDVLDIIKSLGLAKNKASNLIALSKVIEEQHNGEVPNTLEELMKLPGVGRKTASVVLALGFGVPAFPVDTHVHRVSYRLGYSKKNDDVLKTEEKLKKYIPKDEWIEVHHLLLLFGRYTCKSISPICSDCKLMKYCKIKH